MTAEDTRIHEHESACASATERAVLEQRVRLRKLLRTGMAQMQAAVMGAQPPIRSMVATVQVEFSRHLAEADALMPPLGERLKREFAEELGMLRALSSWPEDNDEIELALRFQALAPVLLDVMASEEHHLLATAKSDLTADAPFGR